MTDPHPQARTLAEALEPFALLAARPELDIHGAKMSDPLSKWFTIAQLQKARDALDGFAALASHPPAEPGWVDITQDDIESELGWDPGITTKVLKAINAVGARRFAERASGEEGGDRLTSTEREHVRQHQEYARIATAVERRPPDDGPTLLSIVQRLAPDPAEASDAR